LDKLQEDARNSGQPKAVENGIDASIMIDALLSDGFDPEEPVDRISFLKRMYLCFYSARIGRLPSINDLFSSLVETVIDIDIVDNNDMQKDNEEVLEDHGVEDDIALASAGRNGDS